MISASSGMVTKARIASSGGTDNPFTRTVERGVEHHTVPTAIAHFT